jgi:DNA-binding response OmpR family regulator
MKKVLIIEDEAIISFGYRLQLEQMGFNVIGAARSSAEAETMLAAERPDVIIMDVYLKGEKTGLQLAQEINAIDPIPIIFLTASSKPEVVEGIRSIRDAEYLVKPIDSDSLIGLLHSVARSDA